MHAKRDLMIVCTNVSDFNRIYSNACSLSNEYAGVDCLRCTVKNLIFFGDRVNQKAITSPYPHLLRGRPTVITRPPSVIESILFFVFSYLKLMTKLYICESEIDLGIAMLISF
jgi:hypothetical protein